MPSADPAPLTAEEGALVLYRERSGSGCPNYRRGVRLLVPGVGYLRLRCGASNRCGYCSRLADFELAGALLLDARERPPGHAITLTTRDPDLPASVYRDGAAVLWRRLRRHFGTQVQYASAIEFTTGKRARDGRRRMHGHHLVKGLAGANVLEVESLVRETWEATTGAFIVEVAELVSPGAAIAYLGLHHRKPEQAPPADWRGMRFRASHGYWVRPIAQLRAEARERQAVRRLRHSLAQALGDDVDPAFLDAAAQLERETQLEGLAAARLLRVREPSAGGVLVPLGAA